MDGRIRPSGRPQAPDIRLRESARCTGDRLGKGEEDPHRRPEPARAPVVHYLMNEDIAVRISGCGGFPIIDEHRAVTADLRPEVIGMGLHSVMAAVGLADHYRQQLPLCTRKRRVAEHHGPVQVHR
jgi:hypothetical protein